jgi:4-amino-4-deoxy-L-arabinose transferase-like glycosyltransferase
MTPTPAAADAPNAALPARTFALLCALVAVLWLAGLAHRPLITPDEGRYAEIAREMAASGDWVTPRLNGLKYFEKPPLQAWLTAAGLTVLGRSDAWVRAIPALSGLVTCLAVFLALRRRAGPAAAQAGALLCAGTVWTVANAHFVSLDAGLACWLTVALAGLLGCVESGRAGSRGPSTIAWLGMAGAFLSKGLIGLVIPGAAMAVAALWLRRPGLIATVRWWPGAPIAAALVVPWLALMELRNPGFLQFFFIHEHFQRFTSEVHQRVEPAWYFLPVFALGGLPWLGHWAAAAWAARRRSPGRSGPADPADVLLLAWAGFVFAFFSLSGSKLPSYILPMFPALAIWLARRHDRLSPRALRGAALLPLAAAVVIVAAAIPLVQDKDVDEPIADGRLFLPWVLASGAALAAGAVLAWRLAPRGALRSIAALALGTLAAVQSLQWGHAVYGERLSGRGLAQRVLATEGPIDPAVPIYSVATYDQSLPWYLGRTVTLVDWRDEMGMGLDAEPQKNGPSQAELQRRWPTLRGAYAVLDLTDLPRWQAAGLAWREVGRNGRRVLIAPAEAQ